MSAARALRFIAARPPANLLAVHHRVLSAASAEAAGAGDTAVHSDGPPSDDYADRPPKFSGAAEATEDAHSHDKQTPPPRPTEERVPPFSSSTKLGSQELPDEAGGATFTQKRRFSAAPDRETLEEATPDADEAAARKVREEDREYYRTHKPSPIAEVEFADTRKPITRATDGSADDRLSDVAGNMEEDTVDASLARAEAMFREAASRGNPAWPHSRALAAMLARRREGGAGDADGAPWGT